MDEYINNTIFTAVAGPVIVAVLVALILGGVAWAARMMKLMSRVAQHFDTPPPGQTDNSIPARMERVEARVSEVGAKADNLTRESIGHTTSHAAARDDIKELRRDLGEGLRETHRRIDGLVLETRGAHVSHPHPQFIDGK